MSNIAMQSCTFFELAGAEDARKTSPFCWRIRFALRHKQLQFESKPWRRVEKDVIGFTGQGKVPVLVVGQHTVHDSWDIAEYLEAEYPMHPLLSENDAGRDTQTAGRHAIRFTTHWVDQSLQTAIRNIVSLGAIEVSADKDKEFYIDKLQNVHGISLQDVGGSQQNLSHLHKVLEPMPQMLTEQPFLGGKAPSFSDCAAAGAFAWARSVSPIHLLKEDDPVYAWRARIFELFQEDLTSTIGYPP